MGTTASVLLVANNRYLIGQVGDSASISSATAR
jgi:serine/threonine protein phosphatase PrpC